MAKRDLIVIGGSAASLQYVKAIVGQLPAQFPAAVCVVVHMQPRVRNGLAYILNNGATLPAEEAIEGHPITPGHIYVTSPDRHLVIGNNHMHLTRGPKEGLQRPSINVTFRSAAQTYGPRVIGVLLSGLLDDGAAGLWEIGRLGGVTIVQDPEEAEYPSMPMNALRDAPIHYKVRSGSMAGLLYRLVQGVTVPDMTKTNDERLAEPYSGFSCPECRGPVFRSELTPLLAEFRCRVGHAFSPETLLSEHTSTLERKLYEALVALEEGADLVEYIAGMAEPERRKTLFLEAEQLRQSARGVRRMVEDPRAAPQDDSPTP